jgi:hypothetical protein
MANVFENFSKIPLLDSAAVFFLVAKRRKFATQNKT